MKNIKLKELIESDFNNTPQQMLFLRSQIRRAIVYSKIESPHEQVGFEYVEASDTKYYKIVNVFADSILSDWNE